jgi:hypothetical protein
VSSGSVTACPIPSAQDKALCAFIMSTDISAKAAFSKWKCKAYGIVDSNPCSTTSPWPGVGCEGNVIRTISLRNGNIAGTFSSLVQLSTLTALDLSGNKFNGK